MAWDNYTAFRRVQVYDALAAARKSQGQGQTSLYNDKDGDDKENCPTSLACNGRLSTQDKRCRSTKNRPTLFYALDNDVLQQQQQQQETVKMAGLRDAVEANYDSNSNKVDFFDVSRIFARNETILREQISACSLATNDNCQSQPLHSTFDYPLHSTMNNLMLPEPISEEQEHYVRPAAVAAKYRQHLKSRYANGGVTCHQRPRKQQSREGSDVTRGGGRYLDDAILASVNSGGTAVPPGDDCEDSSYLSICVDDVTDQSSLTDVSQLHDDVIVREAGSKRRLAKRGWQTTQGVSLYDYHPHQSAVAAARCASTDRHSSTWPSAACQASSSVPTAGHRRMKRQAHAVASSSSKATTVKGQKMATAVADKQQLMSLHHSSRSRPNCESLSNSGCSKQQPLPDDQLLQDDLYEHLPCHAVSSSSSHTCPACSLSTSSKMTHIRHVTASQPIKMSPVKRLYVQPKAPVVKRKPVISCFSFCTSGATSKAIGRHGYRRPDDAICRHQAAYSRY